MIPSIENLRCFVAAAHLLNFRSAARSVALSPAALGQRIQQLEQQLGAPLFHRNTRTVSLTEAGLALLPAAERCLQAASECMLAARGELGPAPMELTLGTRYELGMSWILPQLDRLTVALPWLTLHLYFGSSEDLLERVRTMELDCVVTSSRLTEPKLEAVRLHREDYIFVGSTGLLKAQPFSQAEHATAHTLLDMSADLPLFRYFRDAPGTIAPLNFRRTIRLGSIEAIRQRMLQGAGVSVLPRYLLTGDLASQSVRRIFPSIEPLHDWFRLVFHADDPKRWAYEKLAAQLVKEALR